MNSEQIPLITGSWFSSWKQFFPPSDHSSGFGQWIFFAVLGGTPSAQNMCVISSLPLIPLHQEGSRLFHYTLELGQVRALPPVHHLALETQKTKTRVHLV